MRSVGVVGKRIVAIRQFRHRNFNALEAIVLEDGTELRPLHTPDEDSDGTVDMIVVKP